MPGRVQCEFHRKKRLCSTVGCTNMVNKRGLCVRHGARQGTQCCVQGCVAKHVRVCGRCHANRIHTEAEPPQKPHHEQGDAIAFEPCFNLPLIEPLDELWIATLFDSWEGCFVDVDVIELPVAVEEATEMDRGTLDAMQRSENEFLDAMEMSMLLDCTY
ncbi:Aste57867_19894 [Aphanomyces stellatus]|uniref:Aste57867_19894 protein n=1 Tax=Aphanomyces stellatus TaxID=120398 RepID=A0A485LDP7_9STRA|nr:hypothetical protein As57867_019828 [Aphanomyces stellatus]VFT96592.1 Aste57867_19894 [Aphanomyces stellatus]